MAYLKKPAVPIFGSLVRDLTRVLPNFKSSNHFLLFKNLINKLTKRVSKIPDKKKKKEFLRSHYFRSHWQTPKRKEYCF